MNLEYHGHVEIRINNKRHKLKNHGSGHLFRLLTTFLVGDGYNENHLPNYLALYNCSPSDLLSETGAYAEDYTTDQLHKFLINIVSKETTNTPNFSVIFNSVIEPSHVNLAKIVNSARGFSLALVGGDPKNESPSTPGNQSNAHHPILAAVSFDEEYWNNLQNASSAVIQWTLTITNSPEEN